MSYAGDRTMSSMSRFNESSLFFGNMEVPTDDELPRADCESPVLPELAQKHTDLMYVYEQLKAEHEKLKEQYEKEKEFHWEQQGDVASRCQKTQAENEELIKTNKALVKSLNILNYEEEKWTQMSITLAFRLNEINGLKEKLATAKYNESLELARSDATIKKLKNEVKRLHENLESLKKEGSEDIQRLKEKSRADLMKILEQGERINMLVQSIKDVKKQRDDQEARLMEELEAENEKVSWQRHHDVERLEKELESCKKEKQENEEIVKQQEKMIEELRSQLSFTN